MAVSADFRYLEKYITNEELSAVSARVLAAQSVLNLRIGAGGDFCDWLSPETLNSKDEMARMEACVNKLTLNSDIVLVVGIGGSYLGAKAAIDWLCSPLYNLNAKQGRPELQFVGNDVSASHLTEVLARCEGKRVSAIVISKSGGTTEPALAFRVIRQYMVKRYAAEASSRIVAVTDKENGTLRAMANQYAWDSFVIPNGVGGRFSVLTPVGLIPMWVAGVNTAQLLEGAAAAAKTLSSTDFGTNPALLYAAIRYALYNKGFTIELFCGWDPAFSMTLEWMKQLFGESEGKGHMGLFPAAACYTTDLHSLGQFVQDGSRVLFETMISCDEELTDITVQTEETDMDTLNYLNGKSFSEIAENARKAVCSAHYEGGVPVMQLSTGGRTAYEYGWLLYFMEYTCGVGGYTLGVNPFDQPGVESYKNYMFGMLGKPGFDKPRLL